MVKDTSDAPMVADETVALVNRVWEERDSITPSLIERKIPPAFEIYRLLPGKNCKECGYATCLAFAADLCAGAAHLDTCSLLLKPEYSKSRERIVSLFSPGQSS